jgi:hypothetical protein
MRDYGTIQSAYWTHPDIKGISDGAKLLGAYLLTCPHATGLGCFHAPVGYIATDLGWSHETVLKRFQELFLNGFCKRCERTDYVLIPNFLRWNQVANQNVAKARITEYKNIPSGFQYFSELAASMMEFCEFWPNGFETVRQTVTETPSKPEQNRTEQTLSAQTAEKARIERKPRLVDLDRFAEFYAAYPVKKGKEDAIKAWAKLSESEREKAIADVPKRSQMDRQWLDGYAPHPATYLNGKRWADEIEVSRGGNQAIQAQHVFRGDI